MSNHTTDEGTGIIYLLCFGSTPYKHAKHYMGWCKDTRNLKLRLEHHANGTGAHFTRIVAQAGIVWTLARTWPGPRARERQLKNFGGFTKLCPICKKSTPQWKKAPDAGVEK
jgi:predicted GIY-YIG superfamily endonuclease